MNIFSKLAIIVATAAVALPGPSFAAEKAFEQIMCPIETMGEAEMDGWGASLAENNGDLSDTQLDLLTKAVQSCAATNHWTESDAQSAFGFNLTVIGMTAMADKLTAIGLDPEIYEAVLENRSPADLQKIMDDPENSSAILQATEILIEDFGSDVSDEIAADVGRYLAYAAQSRLSALELLQSPK